MQASANGAQKALRPPRFRGTDFEAPPTTPPPTVATAVEQVVQAASAQLPTGSRSISERLTSKFGLGERPSARRDLYKRLEQVIAREGERAYEAVSEAVAASVGARSPGRYFCRVVCLKLRERGITVGRTGQGGDASW